ncbi:MarR family winged helix-turn-helix transcriptional regulator [Frigidibacter sp. RF13]|uniref:MarR family winged helix-turn-helix transcriptional regulator n=1 Tax=Frigidibacter sp. RF13 TaxID=2997340 RepID=UPI00226FB0A7|nr:MarR family winged helix-turn-helix transcriptional regulator [Frigidibacter sp. RF13]MCY1127059.1 MarR family winged helix-turn-helix transcriptional regulator [Frigidibacter sp. RF13]
MDEPFTPPSTEIVAVWTALMRASRHLRDAVEADLKQAGLPPLDWYDVLWEIEQAPDGIRPNALEPRLLLPQYGLSRLIARLVAAGYVTRRPSPGDRRGQLLHLTEAGRSVRRAMWPVYGAALTRSFVGTAAEAEAPRLAALLNGLTGKAPRPQAPIA